MGAADSRLTGATSVRGLFLSWTRPESRRAQAAWVDASAARPELCALSTLAVSGSLHRCHLPAESRLPWSRCHLRRVFPQRPVSSPSSQEAAGCVPGTAPSGSGRQLPAQLPPARPWCALPATRCPVTEASFSAQPPPDSPPGRHRTSVLLIFPLFSQ